MPTKRAAAWHLKAVKVHSLLLELSLDRHVPWLQRQVYRFLWWWVH